MKKDIREALHKLHPKAGDIIFVDATVVSLDKMKGVDFSHLPPNVVMLAVNTNGMPVARALAMMPLDKLKERVALLDKTLAEAGGKS